jgi:nitronate monooxygenase
MRSLELPLPIIQGPMNGASPAELVASVCNAGALGSFAASLLAPPQIVDSVAQIRKLTRQPFVINLFVVQIPQPDLGQVDKAIDRLKTFRDELGLPSQTVPAIWCHSFDAQFEALIETKPAFASFTFGVISAEKVDRLHRSGVKVIGTATNVKEAIAWAAAGADAIVAQGHEAGGHRATFIGDFHRSSIGLMSLLSHVRAAVNLPIIAAGGITDGRGIAAALLLGADAAQLGTAFLVCPESGIPAAWRDQVLHAFDDSTKLTRTFSGRYARGLANRFMREMEQFEMEVPEYPVQNALTTEIRREAASRGNPELIAMWAGQSAARTRALPAAELIRVLKEELSNAQHARTASAHHPLRPDN